MSDMLLQALKKKLEGDVAVAKANIMIYKEKSVGIGEHPDVLEAIEKELAVIAQYMDELEVLNRYFPE